eukprot:scaffold88333_cov28-Tisochrysis_lutea.AAC.3
METKHAGTDDLITLDELVTWALGDEGDNLIDLEQLVALAGEDGNQSGGCSERCGQPVPTTRRAHGQSVWQRIHRFGVHGHAFVVTCRRRAAADRWRVITRTLVDLGGGRGTCCLRLHPAPE